MSTEPKPKVRLSAEYLGPVFSLDGTLTKHAQNLIFARNGTGKSFLSRALRYLDLYGQDREIQNAPSDLVSDESADGLGRFFFGRESSEMGSLELDRRGNSVSASINDTIFHVFSEDFVQEELRERSYEIDGAIDNQISVDRENIKLKDSLEELDKAYPEAEKAENGIRERFEASKRVGLGEKAGINKNLKEYGGLVFKDWLSNQIEKPAPPEHNQASILKDLDRLKSIPAEPILPKLLDTLAQGTLDLKKLSQSLQRLTSPSTVADQIKQKIDTHHEFYAAGTRIVKDGQLETCPFCEQGITDPDPKSIIDAYLNYFSDEEEKHKTELRQFFSELNQLKKSLDGIETLLARQKSRFDELKQFVPSKRDAGLSTCELELAEARKTIGLIQGEIKLKAESLASERSLPSGDLEEQLRQVNIAIEANNSSVQALNQSISKSDDERRSLQRQACLVFSIEFAIDSWNEIEALRTLEARIGSI